MKDVVTNVDTARGFLTKAGLHHLVLIKTNQVKG